MKPGSNIQEFGRLFNQRGKSLQEVQTHWAIVKAVDWDSQTMTATGVVDDLDFHNVVLALGSIKKRPKTGGKCLIGIVNNNPAAAFLIDCEEIEEFEIIDGTGFKINLNNGLLTFNGDSNGGIVIATELKTQIDKNTLILQKMQEVFASWTPVANDGGAALKALVSEFVTLDRADLTQIQNNTVKH